MKKYRLLKKALLYTLFLLTLHGCGASKPFYGEDVNAIESADSVQDRTVRFSIFLIGDAGAPNLSGPDETLSVLQNHLESAGRNASVIFLGDNIYENGMEPDSLDPARKKAEKKIIKSLQALKNYTGTAYFIPGNHDWRKGADAVRAQEKFIEAYNKATATFIPDNGCPGPAIVSLSPEWRMIVIDSEWWINQSYKSLAVPKVCGQKTRNEVLRAFGEALERHKKEKVLVVFHHTLYSNGSHGGYYSFKDHLFPLTNLNKYLYLPLPLLGSVYPVYRKLGYSGQDITNDRYRKFKREILKVSTNIPNIFFASGHEHSLEFFEIEDHHYIVSGSGSKTSYARKGQGADFLYSRNGFAVLKSYSDGSTYVEFWVPDANQKMGRLVFRKKVIKPDFMR